MYQAIDAIRRREDPVATLAGQPELTRASAGATRAAAGLKPA
jgi:hypothetical protein